jgi:hypothetical protein
VGAPAFEQEHVSLVDVLDRVLDRGAVIAGDLTISVADVDLIRLHLQVVLGSAGTLDVSLSDQKDAASIPIASDSGRAR